MSTATARPRRCGGHGRAGADLFGSGVACGWAHQHQVEQLCPAERYLVLDRPRRPGHEPDQVLANRVALLGSTETMHHPIPIPCVKKLQPPNQFAHDIFVGVAEQ
jgi:hypothetical protein